MHKARREASCLQAYQIALAVHRDVSSLSFLSTMMESKKMDEILGECFESRLVVLGNESHAMLTSIITI